MRLYSLHQTFENSFLSQINELLIQGYEFEKVTDDGGVFVIGRILGSGGWSGDRYNEVCVGKRLSSSIVRRRDARQATISHQRRSLFTLRHVIVRCGAHHDRRHQLTY